MKEGEPSDSNGTFRIGGMRINLKNIWGKPMGFVLLAFVIGATISQGSFAFADDSSTNPFRAIWDAIGELQTKTDTLQAQIDDLKAQQGTAVAASPVATKTSDGSVHVEVSGGESGQTIVTIFTRNAGPDSAVGAKLTVFYETSLLRVNFIEGADCSDGSRGIIECYLGTIEDGSDAVVTIDADPIILEQTSRIVAEFSSITRDANPADNHAELLFVTGIAPVAQPETSGGGSSSAEETPAEQEPTEQVPEDTEQTNEETSEAGEEQPQEGEQSSEQGAEESSEQAGEESGSEQSDSESTGEQSEDTGGSSAEEGTGDESGSDAEAGSEEGSAGETGSEETGGSDTGESDAGSEGGDTADSGSSDSGAGDSGGEQSSSEGGDSGNDGSSEGGSSDDGSGSGDSGSEGGSSSDESGSTG